MRLGGGMSVAFDLHEPDDLDRFVEKYDMYGLSTVVAPWGYDAKSEEFAYRFGERAKQWGLQIGEAHSRPNLMIQDADERNRRIKQLNEGIRKAKIMGAVCCCIMAGSAAPEDNLAAPHPFNYTKEAKILLRDALLRAIDGIDMDDIWLVIEPWPNTFFYQPDAICEFLDFVEHPKVGLHMDLMNMIDIYHYYNTTELINKSFDLLGHRIGAVHLKDISWDWKYFTFMKLDEVPVGDGVIDYETFIRRIAGLGWDVPCFCEHATSESIFAQNFARLHRQAAKLGVSFKPRGV